MGIGSRIQGAMQQQPQQQGTPQSAFPQPIGGKGGRGGRGSNIARQMPIDRTQQPPAQMGGKGAMQSFQNTMQGQQPTQADSFQALQNIMQGQGQAQQPLQLGQVQQMQQDQAAALAKQQIMQGGQFTPDPATIFPRQQPLQQVQYPNQMPQGLAALLQNQQTGGM